MYAKKRVASSAKEEVTHISPVKKPLTRSEVCSLDPLLYVLCQEETTDPLHQEKYNPRVNQLKMHFKLHPSHWHLYGSDVKSQEMPMLVSINFRVSGFILI